MFPSLSTCVKHVGNGRSTFISALGLLCRLRQNDLLKLLFKRRATIPDSVAENALTLPLEIGRFRMKQSDMPAKPLIQCSKQLFFQRQALIIQYPICGLRPLVQGFLN